MILYSQFTIVCNVLHMVPEVRSSYIPINIFKFSTKGSFGPFVSSNFHIPIKDKRKYASKNLGQIVFKR